MHVEYMTFTFRQFRAILLQTPQQLLLAFSGVKNILLARRASRFLRDLHAARHWFTTSWAIMCSQLATPPRPPLLLEMYSRARYCEGLNGIQDPSCWKWHLTLASSPATASTWLSIFCIKAGYLSWCKDLLVCTGAGSTSSEAKVSFSSAAIPVACCGTL